MLSWGVEQTRKEEKKKSRDWRMISIDEFAARVWRGRKREEEGGERAQNQGVFGDGGKEG